MKLFEKISDLFALRSVSGLVLRVRPGGFQVTAYPAIPAKTTTTTLTANEVCQQLITGNSGAAAATYTLPTSAQLLQEISRLAGGYNPDIGEGFDVNIVNISTTGTGVITIAAGTGITLVGNMLIAANTAVTDNSQGIFRFIRTTAGFTVYRVG